MIGPLQKHRRLANSTATPNCSAALTKRPLRYGFLEIEQLGIESVHDEPTGMVRWSLGVQERPVLFQFLGSYISIPHCCEPCWAVWSGDESRVLQNVCHRFGEGPPRVRRLALQKMVSDSADKHNTPKVG